MQFFISYLLFKNVSTFLNNNDYKKQEVLAPDTRCPVVTSWGIIRQSGHMTCAFLKKKCILYLKKNKKNSNFAFWFSSYVHVEWVETSVTEG